MTLKNWKAAAKADHAKSFSGGMYPSPPCHAERRTPISTQKNAEGIRRQNLLVQNGTEKFMTDLKFFVSGISRMIDFVIIKPDMQKNTSTPYPKRK
jgi:hypothetical protein